MCGFIDYWKKKDSLNLKEEVNGKSSLGQICNERKFTMGWICHREKMYNGQKIFLLTCIFNCSHLNFFLLNNLLWILCILLLFCPFRFTHLVCNKTVIHVGHICYYPPDIFWSPNLCEDQNMFMGQWKCFKETYIIEFQYHSKSVLKTLYLFQHDTFFSIYWYFSYQYILVF